MSSFGQKQNSDAHDLTGLLRRMGNGDQEAYENVATLIYQELHRIAAREMRRERGNHALRTTALMHEAFLKIAGAQPLEIENRGHFFALASQQMRRILVDHARARRAQKRGGEVFFLGLEGVHVKSDPPGIDILLLDEVLNELQRLDAKAARVVELRYFGGYTDREVAEVMGTSTSTVRREWEFAKSWLFDRMNGTRPLP